MTLAGVTTVVGVLGTDGTTRTVRDLVARIYGLRDEGLSAWCWTGSYEVPPITLTGRVRDDIAFIEPVIGVGEVAISDHRSSQPTFDELVRLAADAHVGGLMTGKAGVLHLHLGDGPRGLSLVRRALDETELPARVFHPTHVNRQRRLLDEARALCERGVTIDVTAYDGDDDGVSAEDALAGHLDLGLAPDRITCSSDGGGCIPTFGPDGRVTHMDVGRSSALLATIRALEGRGYPLFRVLPAFTTNVAHALRLPRKGRLEPGADADLVVLGPALTVRSVMARGRWLVREGSATLGPFEAASTSRVPPPKECP
jgi:beta-aspartyl-dipeptidase (metallo-type)